MRSTIQRAWACLLLFPLAAAGAQDAAPRPRVYSETIDVRVVNVETVVTDREGNPVQGLKAGDFRLLVDGREVPVEFFTEVSEGATAQAAPAPGGGEPGAPGAPLPAGETVWRNYLVLVDDSFAVADRRNAALDRIRADLPLLGEEDRMAVLAYDGSGLQVLAGWTADRAALGEALDAARRRPTRGNGFLAGDRQTDANVAFYDAILATEEYPDELRARLVADLNAWGTPEARVQLGKTARALSGALRGFEAPPGRKVMLLLSAGWSLQVDGAAFGPFVADANRLGYTVYPVDVATQDPVSLKAFNHLAAKTGGRVASSARAGAFREVVEDSGSYYWIGFTPTWKADDRHHRVEVEVRRAGLQARARAGFSDLSERTASAMKAEGVLLFGGHDEDRRLIVQIGEPRAAGRRKVDVPVTLGVPVEALALKPDGDGYLAETALAVASLDGDGERAELPTLRLRVKIPQVPPAGTYARFQTVVKLRRVEQRLVFTVHDAVSGSMMWGEAEVVPRS
jgi:VWFA-related protein